MEIYNPTNDSLFNTQTCLSDPCIDTSEGGCAKGTGQGERTKTGAIGTAHAHCSPSLCDNSEGVGEQTPLGKLEGQKQQSGLEVAQLETNHWTEVFKQQKYV